MAIKQEKLKKTAIELIKEEYQTGMKEKLEQGLQQLTERLSQRGELSTIEVRNLLSRKTVIGITPKYSNAELGILFEYYKQYMEAINKKQTFVPTKKNFCSFIGISSAVYQNWLQSEDPDRRETMQMIDDYVTDIMLTEAQNGNIKEVTTIFRTKAEHGMVEASAPVVIEHKSETNLDNILKQIQAVNQGRSLKSIELEKGSNGVYGNGGTNED